MDESRLADTLQKYEKKGIGGMSRQKNPKLWRWWLISHALRMFLFSYTFMFLFVKEIWSSLGILVLSVGCFSLVDRLWKAFCGMKLCESWWLEFDTPHNPCMGLMEAEHMQASWTRKKTGGWKEHWRTTSFFGWLFQTFFITVLFTPKIWGNDPILMNICFEWDWNHQLGHHSDSEHFFLKEEKECNINKIPDAQRMGYLPTFFSKTTQVYIGK